MQSDPYKQENLRSGAFHYLWGRGAAGVAGFLTVLLLVRYMDLHNYAAYTALSGLVALCGVLAGLGMERVVARYVPEARLFRSASELSRFIWLTGLIRLTAALFVAGLLCYFWSNVDRFLAISKFEIFPIWIAAFIVGETMFQHFSSVLQSLVMQKALTRLLIIQWAGRLAFILTVIFSKGTIDWEDALMVNAIPELLGVVGFIVVIQLHLRKLPQDRNEKNTGPWPQWRNVAQIGLHNYGFTLLATPPQGHFMKVLTAAYLPEEIVAAYGFFLSVAEKARQYIPLHFFYGMLEPVMIAAYLKDRDFTALSYRCQLLYKSNLMLMVPAIAWIATAGNPIVGAITGGKFQGLSWILLLVMTQLTIGSHVVLLQLILNSLEKSEVLITASIVALPIMFIGMVISAKVNPYWLLGAPLLFSVAMNFYIIYQLSASKHPYKPSWTMIGGVTLAGFLAFLAVMLYEEIMKRTVATASDAAFCFLAILTFYSIAIWTTKVIDKDELNLIRTIFKK